MCAWPTFLWTKTSHWKTVMMTMMREQNVREDLWWNVKKKSEVKKKKDMMIIVMKNNRKIHNKKKTQKNYDENDCEVNDNNNNNDVDDMTSIMVTIMVRRRKHWRKFNDSSVKIFKIRSRIGIKTQKNKSSQRRESFWNVL
jgi:hypothetical protein